MKLSANIVLSRHGIFYLRSYSNGKETRVSLRTRDPIAAKLAAYAFGLAKAEFAMSKKPVLPYSVKIGPGGAEVTTDGSQQDHENALAALALLQAQTAKASSDPYHRAAEENVKNALNAAFSPTVSMTIREVVSGWEVENPNLLKASSKYEYMLTLKRLVAACGGAPIAGFGRVEFAAYRSKYIDSRGMSAKAESKELGCLKALFEWAVLRGYSQESPVHAKLRTKREAASLGQSRPRRPYTAEELAKVFDPSNILKQPDPCDFWLPFLALFTGCRVNELASLRQDDILHDADMGYYISIREGKTDAASRVIPLHTEILKAGFLEFVETIRRDFGGVQLWPHLQPDVKNGLANRPSKRFGIYLKSLGIEGVVFHSFRHTFVSCLQSNNVEQWLREKLAGHEPGSKEQGVNATVYSHAIATPILLSQTIERLDYQHAFGFAMPAMRPDPIRWHEFMRRMMARKN
jgi:integrase